MDEFQWQRLIYVLAILVLVGPGAWWLWRAHGKFWRDIALWGGIVAAVILLYLAVGPQ